MSKRRFKTPKKMEKAAIKYLKRCNKTGHPITIAGFCDFAGISEKNYYQNYAQAKGFKRVASRLKTKAKLSLIENALLGNYNATVAKMMLEKNHSLGDPLDLDIKNGDPEKLILQLMDLFSQRKISREDVETLSRAIETAATYRLGKKTEEVLDRLGVSDNKGIFDKKAEY